MKRLSVLLSIVAASLSVSAQDIEIVGNLCIDENLTFKGNTPVRYDSFLWDFGDGSTSTDKEPTHAFTATGSYTVTLSSKSNGTDEITGSKTITVNAFPKIEFDVDSTAQRTAKVFTPKTVATDYTYSWNFGDGAVSADSKAEHTYSAPGIYTVILTVTDNQNCSDTTMRTVVVDPSSKVPNVFTPNGDGTNDCFMISANGARLKLEIFNRWGYKMFSRTGTENIVWDGYNPQGTLVAPGTYFYVITVEEGSTNYDPLNGYITVYY